MKKSINIENIEKVKKIKKELAKLNKIYKDIDGDKKKVVDNLIQNAAFMSVSLKELQEAINIKGYTEEYQNGEHQKGIKKAPEVDIYNTMIKNYSTVTKQLLDLLPKNIQDQYNDGFEEFVFGREDF